MDKRFLHLFILLLTIIPGQSGKNICVETDYVNMGICLHDRDDYKLTKSQTACQQGYLVEILNEDITSLLINRHFYAYRHNNNSYWIGLSLDNVYTWDTSGRNTSGYENWNSAAHRNKSCVVVKVSDATWVDTDCDAKMAGYLCQYEIATAEPIVETTPITDEQLLTTFPEIVTTSPSSATKGRTTMSPIIVSPTTQKKDDATTITTTANSTTIAIDDKTVENRGNNITYLTIEERLTNATVDEVNAIVQNETLNADDVVKIQEWFEQNSVVSKYVSDIGQYTKEYLNTFNKIIITSDEHKFEKANPAIFAEACNKVLEQFAQRSSTSRMKISFSNIEGEVVETVTSNFTGFESNFASIGQEESYLGGVISITNDWMEDLTITSQRKIEIISVLYHTAEIGHVGNVTEDEVVSSMVSITVLLDGITISVPVKFGLELKRKDVVVTTEVDGLVTRLIRKPTCVFWDKQSKNESGCWNNSGCYLTYDNETYVRCYCNHTTNFAILMQTTEIEMSEIHKTALSLLSLIGLGISTVALLLTILVLLCLPSLKSDRVFIHKHLVVALIIAQILFISTTAAVHNKFMCKLVAILLHYSYLAVFTWMLIEGVHLYLEIVQVFSRFDGKSKTVQYIISGWGFPFIIVMVSVAIRWQGYGQDIVNQSNNDTVTSCWLSTEDGLIWAFVGPVIVVILTNFIILLMVVKVVFRASSSRGKEDSEYKHLTAALKGALFLLPLLGLSWVVGFMMINEGTLVFQYLFVILNSLQGLFIFIIYCAMNKEVRAALSRRFSRVALESGDSKSISLRAVAKLKSSGKSTSPVLRFNESSGNSFPSKLLELPTETTEEPVSASGISVHTSKSDSLQTLVRSEANKSPFMPDYD